MSARSAFVNNSGFSHWIFWNDHLLNVYSSLHCKNFEVLPMTRMFKCKIEFNIFDVKNEKFILAPQTGSHMAEKHFPKIKLNVKTYTL